MRSDWSDIYVAYQVAQLGTLSAAAESLDVHHSTVLRRINTLEKHLATKLFHRHARGYVPTEAGEMLVQFAENTQSDLDRLMGKIQGVDNALSGTLIITTVSTLAPLLLPIVANFQSQYPNIKVEYAAESRIFKLAHGEAHIGIRPGTKPSDPDYVVQKLANVKTSLYANKQYVDTFGLISDINDVEQISQHQFISTIKPYNVISFMRWINQNVKPAQIRFKVNDISGFIPAVKAGLGIAPIGCLLAKNDPELIEMATPPSSWEQNLWLVTHGDMHRVSKVQAFTQFIKQAFLNL